MSKLGILLTTAPEHENTHTVVKLVEAALASGKEVQVFLMCDGVFNALDRRFVALAEKGARLVLCAHTAKERGLANGQGPAQGQGQRVEWGSQLDLAIIVNESDRFVAFN